MPLILETIVTTHSDAHGLHLVPFGLIREDGSEEVVLAPFRPSPTITNIDLNPTFAAAAPTDMRVIAGIVTGRRDWPVVDCARIPGKRLADCYAHAEFAVSACEDDPVRPRYRARMVHAQSHAPFLGYNRAQAAVLEAAILSTRLDRLPPEKIRAEMAYLAIAIEKTAGLAEREAWGWIADKVAMGLARRTGEASEAAS